MRMLTPRRLQHQGRFPGRAARRRNQPHIRLIGEGMGLEALEPKILLASDLDAVDPPVELFGADALASAIEADDHGNSSSSATSIGVPSVTSGNIEQTNDVDWFRFNSVAGTDYDFSVTHITLTDHVLRLIQPNGQNTIWTAVNSGINWTAPTSNTYYLSVAPFGSKTGLYALNASGGGTPTPSATLTLDIQQSTMPENGGSSVATVTRNSGTSGNLTVSLSVDDPTEATVPASVTILNGSNSATFTVSARDDTIADGTQTVTVTASATGHTSDSDTIQVLDNEGDDHGNNAGTATTIGVPSTTSGIISPLGDRDFFRVALTSGIKYTFETSLGTISDTEMSLYGTNGTSLLAYNDDRAGGDLASKIEFTPTFSGNYYVEVQGFDDEESGTYTLSASAEGGGGGSGPLTLTIVETAIVENGGTAQGTVTRTGSTVGPLLVTLTSSDTTEAVVPPSVTIANGQTSAPFTVTAVDDTSEDGPQTVTITGSATGFNNVSDTIQVLDDDADDHGDTPGAATPVGVPSSTPGVLELNDDLDYFRFNAIAGTEYTIETVLGSLDDSYLKLFGSNGIVELAHDDDAGPLRASKIVWTAAATESLFVEVSSFLGQSSGSYSLNISTDGGGSGNESLTVSFDPTAISEDGGTAQGTVTRTGPTTTPLTVTLTSNDPTEAVVPSTRTIPSGLASTTFVVTGVDDTTEDGTQTVTITASAAGFVNGTGNIQVLDDDTDDHGNNASASTAVSVPSSTPGNLEQDEDVDWFKINAVAGVEYTFETHLGSLSDSVLTVYGADGTSVLAFDDDSGGDHLASRIDLIAPTTGPLYAEVASYNHSHSGTYTLDISRDGVPPGNNTLTLDIAAASISENGGTSQVTVTRSGSTSGSLLVTLTNSDTSEATVPSSVTIPNNSSSTTFTLTSVNDSLLDGTQTVTITASASGYIGASDSVLVLDDDGAVDDHGNNAGTSTSVAVPSTTAGNLERNDDLDWFRINAVAGEDYTFETELGTLPDSVLTIFAADGVTVLATNDDGGAGRASRAVVTAPATGPLYAEVSSYRNNSSGTYTIDISGTGAPPAGDTLTVSIVEATIPENGGTSQVTVTRSGSTSGSLLVSLTNSDTSEATVPSTVTIPSNSSTTTFTLTAVDDSAADGTQTVTITASAAGYTSGSDTVLVLDDEGGDDHGNEAATSTLVGVPSSTPGNLEVATDLDVFQFVAVAGAEYTIETELGTLPDSVLRLLGTDGVTQLSFNDDGGVGLASKIVWTAPADGTYYAEVASYHNRSSGTYILHLSADGIVTPPESLTLSIVQSAILENGGSSQATVTRSGDTTGNVTVHLVSSDTTEATVPATVTILNGSDSATFTVTGVNDAEVDGTQTVTVTATASGYASSSDTVNVLDDDGQDDHGDYAGAATPVGIPSLTAGVIEAPADSDWFSFPATSGTTYTLEPIPGTLDDIIITLYGPDGTSQIWSALKSRIVWSAPTTDTYFVSITPFGVKSGTYHLSASAATSPPPAGSALTLTLQEEVIPEIGGTSEAVVMRNTGSSGDLVVHLTSSDTTEATVPPTVTIVDGTDSVRFTVTAVDDAIEDGTQSVTITAQATGYTDGTDTLLVTDEQGDDHGDSALGATPVLVPSLTQGEIEDEDDTDWFQFDATAGTDYTIQTVLGTLEDTVLVLYDTDGTTVIDENDDFGGGTASRIEFSPSVSGTYFFEVTPYSIETGTYEVQITMGLAGIFTLDIEDPFMFENGGSSQATVSRGTMTDGDLTVTLTSSDTTEATVPASVTILDGTSSAMFTVTAVDDADSDGTQTVTITALATGFAVATDTIQVLDNESDDHGNNAANSTDISVPSSTPGNIHVSTDVDWMNFEAIADADYVFETTLFSLTDTTLTLYDTNGTSILAFDDDGGPGLASRIAWTAPSAGTYFVQVASYGSRTGTYSLESSVTLPPPPSLELTIAAAEMSENGGSSQATVTRNTGTSGALTVSLSSNDTSEATVPSTVTIASGSDSATFTITAVNDSATDGIQTVTITASASGLVSGSDTIMVLDDDGDDHGDDWSTATTVNVPSATLANIETGGDLDYFKFQATASRNYTIETMLGSLNDTVLTLFGTNGTTQLAFDDDGGDGLASRINWQAPAAGTYYVQVRAYSTQRVGTYTLDIRETAGDQNVASPEEIVEKAVDALFQADAPGGQQPANQLLTADDGTIEDLAVALVSGS